MTCSYFDYCLVESMLPVHHNTVNKNKNYLSEITKIIKMCPLFTKFTTTHLNQISSISRPKLVSVWRWKYHWFGLFTNCEGLPWVFGGYLAAPSFQTVILRTLLFLKLYKDTNFQRKELMNIFFHLVHCGHVGVICELPSCSLL